MGLLPRSIGSIPKNRPKCNKARNIYVTNLQQFTIGRSICIKKKHRVPDAWGNTVPFVSRDDQSSAVRLVLDRAPPTTVPVRRTVVPMAGTFSLVTKGICQEPS